LGSRDQARWLSPTGRDAVRLFTRRGYYGTDRYRAIAVTAIQLRARSFTLDGEACVCGRDGVAIRYAGGSNAESLLASAARNAGLEHLPCNLI
jgi:ATP-dependent DNA ligase